MCHAGTSSSRLQPSFVASRLFSSLEAGTCVSEAARQGNTVVVIAEQPHPFVASVPDWNGQELFREESPWRVDDVHGRSVCDSLVSAATHSHSLLWCHAIPPSVSDGVLRAITGRCRTCELTTPRTSRANILTTSPRLPGSNTVTNKTRVLECFQSLLWFAWEGTGVSKGARAQSSPLFCSAD